MDASKFDRFTRSLSSGASRRSVMRGLFGGAAAIAGVSKAAGAPAAKVDICHYDRDTGTFGLINVSGNALQAHLNHGDMVYKPEMLLAQFSMNATDPSAVDSGVFLADGDSVYVSITGTSAWCCGNEFDANGQVPCGYLDIPFNCGSVVGVIGGGDILQDHSPFFEVGTGGLVTATGNSGNLFLQYVDGCLDCYDDNNGSLHVIITSIPNC